MTRLRVFTACLAVAPFAASGFPLGMAEAAAATPEHTEPPSVQFNMYGNGGASDPTFFNFDVLVAGAAALRAARNSGATPSR